MKNMNLLYRRFLWIPGESKSCSTVHTAILQDLLPAKHPSPKLHAPLMRISSSVRTVASVKPHAYDTAQEQMPFLAKVLVFERHYPKLPKGTEHDQQSQDKERNSRSQGAESEQFTGSTFAWDVFL